MTALPLRPASRQRRALGLLVLLSLGLLTPASAHPHTLDELLGWPLEQLLQVRVTPRSIPGPRARPPVPARQERR